MLERDEFAEHDHGVFPTVDRNLYLIRRTIPNPPPFLPPSNTWGSSPDFTTLPACARSTPRNIPFAGFNGPCAIMMRALSGTGFEIRLGFSTLRQTKAAPVSTHSLVISLASLWHTFATWVLFSSDCRMLGRGLILSRITGLTCSHTSINSRHEGDIGRNFMGSRKVFASNSGLSCWCFDMISRDVRETILGHEVEDETGGLDVDMITCTLTAARYDAAQLRTPL